MSTEKRTKEERNQIFIDSLYNRVKKFERKIQNLRNVNGFTRTKISNLNLQISLNESEIEAAERQLGNLKAQIEKLEAQ